MLAVWYIGTRHVSLRTKKKINTPADLAGVKLRMPAGEGWQFIGTALGANPVPVAFTEVYTALQTGAIDAQDNPMPLTRTMKFQEVLSAVRADRPPRELQRPVDPQGEVGYAMTPTPRRQLSADRRPRTWRQRDHGADGQGVRPRTGGLLQEPAGLDVYAPDKHRLPCARASNVIRKLQVHLRVEAGNAGSDQRDCDVAASRRRPASGRRLSPSDSRARQGRADE
jgi:hypothetical protein